MIVNTCSQEHSNVNNETHMNIRKRLSLFFPSLLTFDSIAGVCRSAYAQKAAVPRPRIDNFYAAPIDQTAPGTELTFTVEGTPHGKACIRVSGIGKNIPLEEVDNGIYRGSYIIGSNDRLASNTSMRAILRVRNLSAAASRAFDNSATAGADLKFAAAGTGYEVSVNASKASSQA
jgi:hypothetical protein